MAEGTHPRAALITGGCGDIGVATAAAFAAAGYSVCALDLLADAAGRQTLDAAGLPEAGYLRCDVRDRDAVRQAVAAVEREHGGVDVLIANAGITRSTPALAVSEEEWRQVLGVNLDGAFHAAQEAAASMVRLGRSGVLLFTGSWVGEVPSRGLLPYCVSKAGMAMLARCLALELAPHGIRANVVAPGVLDAGVSAQIFRQFPERRAPFEALVPLGSLGTAAQVAEALLFLASDAAAYVTGTTLLVDGGASLFQSQP